MYSDHAIRDRSLQGLSAPSTQNHVRSVVSIASVRQSEDTDPLGVKVFDTVKRLLSNEDQVAVRDVVEAIGMDVGESAVRDRLNALVESGCLECLPGSGRRPSYYYLPDDIQPNEDLSDEALLKRLKRDQLAKSQRVAEIQDLLDAALTEQQAVESDIEALERVIEVKSRFRAQSQAKQGEG